MRYYESLYIINPNYEDNRLDETMKMVSEKCSDYGLKIINHRIWGKKRLAYSCLLYTSPSPRDRG